MHRQPKRIRYALGIVLGLGTQAFFLFTVWRLFWFLKESEPTSVSQQGLLWNTLWIDVLLAVQFAIPHSLMLIPTVRKYLSRWISRDFFPLFYCNITCVNLLLMFIFWRTSNLIVWEFTGLLNGLVQGGFYLSWIALIYSLSLSGFGYQSGLPQWWHWVRHQPIPMQKFEPRGAYLWIRHPVYLSFAGLIWFTPRMTFDHAILTGFWTLYILVGSVMKDRRMVHYLGDTYRKYQQRAPGFPLMPFGPFGRRKAALPMNELVNRKIT